MVLVVSVCWLQILLKKGDAFICTQRLAYLRCLNRFGSHPTTIVYFKVSHIDHDVLKDLSLDNLWVEYKAAPYYLESKNEAEAKQKLMMPSRSSSSRLNAPQQQPTDAGPLPYSSASATASAAVNPDYLLNADYNTKLSPAAAPFQPTPPAATAAAGAAGTSASASSTGADTPLIEFPEEQSESTDRKVDAPAADVFAAAPNSIDKTTDMAPTTIDQSAAGGDGGDGDDGSDSGNPYADGSGAASHPPLLPSARGKATDYSDPSWEFFPSTASDTHTNEAGAAAAAAAGGGSLSILLPEPPTHNPRIPKPESSAAPITLTAVAVDANDGDRNTPVVTATTLS